MMAAIILVCSVAFFLQFFVPYCRSVIASSAGHVLSPEVQDVTGISKQAAGDDFARVMQLLMLCPDRPEDRGEIRAIGVYFRLLSVIKTAAARLAPSLLVWAEKERGRCTYFAAVALDRRVAFSRDLLAQQIEA
ncbi:MAG: hypothetical protein ABSH13_13925 [Candidatus Acidiferrum sp.]|jgi:hypothetical protein